MYSVRLYDHDLTLLRVIKATDVRTQLRINGAGNVSAAFPYDMGAVVDLELAANIAVYRLGEQKFSGQINSRDAKNEVTIEALGHESLLREYFTPSDWEGWNGLDLADVARDALRPFRFRRYKSQDQWGEALETFQCDTETIPGSVIVEYEPHPDDPDNERPKGPPSEGQPNAWKVFRLYLGGSALSDGRLVRWSETVGDTERVTIQTRSASTESALNGTAWGPEMTAVHVDELKENEVKGVPASGAGEWLDVKVNLYAEDRTTVNRDGQGNIVSYGFTPELKGLEVIWREQEQVLFAGRMPESTGIIVEGFVLDRFNHLEAISDICEFYGWEFKTRLHEADRKIYFDLGQQDGSEWVPTMGELRTKESDDPIILRHKTNAEITSYRDSRDNMANVLHCWGPGTGPERLHIRLEDEVSIQKYGAKEDHFDYPEGETMEKLEEAGLRELAKRSNPDMVFEVLARAEAKEPFGLGDYVTVVSPETGVVLDLRIKEENRGWSDNGEDVRLGVGEALENPFELTMGPVGSAKDFHPVPEAPSQVSAQGYYGYIIISWRGEAELFAIRYRSGIGQEWRIRNTRDKHYTHTGLSVGQVFEYQVAAVRNGRISAWSPSVSAEAGALPQDDVDIPIPSTPVFDTSEFITDVTLRWFPADHAASYELRTDQNWGNTSGLVYRGDANQHRFVPTQRTYTFYLRAINAKGQYSTNHATISLSKPTPATPDQPVVTTFFGALRITPIPIAEQGILGYWVYVKPQGQPEEKLFCAPGDALIYQAESGTTCDIQVSAFDVVGEGGKSTVLQATTTHLQNADAPPSGWGQNSLEASLSQKIDDAKELGLENAQLIISMNERVEGNENWIAQIDLSSEQIRNTVLYVNDEEEGLEAIWSQVIQLANEWTVKINAAGQVIGIGLAGAQEDEPSTLAVVADRFSIAHPDTDLAEIVFVVEEGSLHLKNNLIAEGSIRANQLETDITKTLLLQAELAFIDEADVLRLRVDRLTVGGGTAGLTVAKPQGALLWHLDRSLMSTDGTLAKSILEEG